MKQPFQTMHFNPLPGSEDIIVLFAGESQTVPLHFQGPQVLDYYLMHIALSGKGNFDCRGRHYELERGDSFFIFPGELVKYAADEHDPWRYRWFAMTGEGVERMLESVGVTRERPVRHHRRPERIARLIMQMQQRFQRWDNRCDLLSEACVRLILAEYREPGQISGQHAPQDAVPKQVDQAIRWFTLNYAQPTTIEAVADSLGYHRTHFSKLFKKYTGMSPLQFLTKIRMERAKQLLRKEPLTVEQVASSVGYTDALYFSRQFKRWHGMPPSDFRKQ